MVWLSSAGTEKHRLVQSSAQGFLNLCLILIVGRESCIASRCVLLVNETIRFSGYVQVSAEFADVEITSLRKEVTCAVFGLSSQSTCCFMFGLLRLSLDMHPQNSTLRRILDMHPQNSEGKHFNWCGCNRGERAENYMKTVFTLPIRAEFEGWSIWEHDSVWVWIRTARSVTWFHSRFIKLFNHSILKGNEWRKQSRGWRGCLQMAISSNGWLPPLSLEVIGNLLALDRRETHKYLSDWF